MFKRNKWQTCVQQEESKESMEKHIKKTMNKRNTWGQKTKISIVEGPVEEVFLRENNTGNKENEIKESIWTFRGEHGNDKCQCETWN